MIYDISQLEDIVAYTHLAGLCVSLTGVAFADLLGLRLLFSTRHRPRAKDFRRLYGFALFGLFVLWVPTLGDAALRYGPAGFPPGVYINIVIAGLLTISGIRIRHQLVPLARYRYRPLVLSLSFRNLSSALTFASVSLVSWVFALSVALIGIVHDMPLVELAMRVPLVWAGFLFSLYFLVILIRGIWTLDRTPRRH
ncbi:MAG: hypothetical protein ACR2PM_03525 [Hyphomicrobiales bacterium]